MALAAAADVVVESFRPGVVDRLGIGYDAVKARNPGIVYCSTSGYGQDGPRAGWAGHDLDYLAVGGYLAMSTPGANGAPPLPGATIADAAAGGMQAALAITAALAGRAHTGVGAYLDVSVADGVLWLMSLAIDEQLARGGEIHPGHDVLSGGYACYATYRTADDKWVAVAAIEPKFFANLCAALGSRAGGAPATTTQRRTRHPRRPRRGLRRADARRVGRRTRSSRHLRGAGPRRSPRWPPTRSSSHGAPSSRATPPDGGRVVAAGAAPGRHGATRVGGAGGAARHGADGDGASLEGGRCGRRDGGALAWPEWWWHDARRWPRTRAT